MKRHAVIVAIHAKHSDLEISQFLNATRELEASDGNAESVVKRRKHTPRHTQLEH